MIRELETHAPENLILVQVFLVKLNTLKQTVPGSQTYGSKSRTSSIETVALGFVEVEWTSEGCRMRSLIFSEASIILVLRNPRLFEVLTYLV